MCCGVLITLEIGDRRKLLRATRRADEYRSAVRAIAETIRNGGDAAELAE